jgi:hypothetical protein
MDGRIDAIGDLEVKGCFFRGFPAFGGNYNYAIGATYAKYGGCGSVFENGEALNFIGA